MFRIIILLLFLLICFLILKGAIKIIKINRIINKMYPSNRFSKNERRMLKRILKQMNSSFTSEFNFIKYSAKKFLKWSPPHSKSEDGFHQYLNQNIQDEALERIRELIRVKNQLQDGVYFYGGRIRKVKKALMRLESDSKKYGYEKYFKQLYLSRIRYLKNVIKCAEEAKSELINKIDKCNTYINELSKIKNPTIFHKAIKVITAPLTAPFRHTYNIIDGFINNDMQKLVKAGGFLGLGFIGIGILADVLDALDGFDALDTSSLEFVDPHEVSGYTRADGVVVDAYYRDGDGEPLTSLNKEEGGGYWRS